MRQSCRRHRWAVVAMLLVIGGTACPQGAWGQGRPPREARIQVLEERLFRPPKAWPRATPPQGGAEPQGLRFWDVQTVAPVVGSAPAIVLDFAGRPCTAYSDRTTTRVLRYGCYDGASWTFETVDSAVQGASVALAMDASGHPHLSYIAEAGSTDLLRHAYHDGSSWQLETVTGVVIDLFGPGDTAIAAGPGELLYLVYPDSGLQYARFDGAAWTLGLLDPDTKAGFSPSLRVDPLGRAHLSYGVDTFPRRQIKYASHDGAGWQVQLLTDDAYDYNSALALDAAGRPHIAYGSGSDLLYAHWDGAAWQTMVMESASTASGVSLAIDASGAPHLNYLSGSGLVYTYLEGGQWIWEIVEGDGFWPALALDGAGRQHILFVVDPYVLKYATPITDIAPWTRLSVASYQDWETLDFEVWISRGDGAWGTRLTNNPAWDSTPRLSPGATQVAFASYRDGNQEIYRMNVDGSAQTRLTWTADTETLPAWSPDGSRIVFCTAPEALEEAEILVMNADGSGQTRLTWNSAWDGHPAWSPDGRKIAFSSARSGAYELWTMDPNGDNPQQLTFGLGFAAYPAWSPDGARIAFSDDYNGDTWLDLAIINADGTGLVHPFGASIAQIDAMSPVWSPDGGILAFCSVQWFLYNGNWYWTSAAIDGYYLQNNLRVYLTPADYSWWPDWRSVDVVPPASQVAALPAYSGMSIAVQWSALDTGGAGLRSYDVQYRQDGGPWADWLLATAQTTASFAAQEGHTYYFRSRARDYAGNLEEYPGGDGDTHTAVDLTPPASSAHSPDHADAPTFVVDWSGSDNFSGIAAYDVQYRVGAGQWTYWLLGTTRTAAVFRGQLGHTYYFQCRARDNAGNQEPFPGGDGDTVTYTPLYALHGTVRGTSEQPIVLAAVQSAPAALGIAFSGVDGQFSLYYNQAGTMTLSVARAGFGILPAMSGVAVPGGVPPVFYLPPADEHVAGGQFEGGDLGAWTLSGDVLPTLAGPGHTGASAAALGGAVPPPVITPTTAFSAVAVLTASGGVLTAGWAAVQLPAGALSGTAVLTLTGMPTVTALPTGTQGLGQHLALTLALTDGTLLTQTLAPFTLTVTYQDAAWQSARLDGEETLRLWRQEGSAWEALTSTVDLVSNTVRAQVRAGGVYALLGAPEQGPWQSVLEQELDPGTEPGVLSLLYSVAEADPSSDTLRLVLWAGTEILTYTVPLAGSGWVHRWWDAGAWDTPTLTLRIEYLQADRDISIGIRLDEISLGSYAVGGFVVYLPIVAR